MSEIVDRAEQAVSVVLRAADLQNGSWDNHMRHVVRAVIKEIQKPTPSMQAAGSGALGIEGLRSVTSYGAAGRAWVAMINRLLED